jgi:DEAD/DEAH box helicase domain-containing protein
VELLKRGLKTIVFTKARRITELLYSWLRQQEPTLASKVASYRSGFLPGERRKIERDLFEGRLAGVISTSALEMGIDVGGLDACILVGFPGSIMATWQRSGRVGRAGRESITALVALPDALDQYLLEHPLELVERPYERLIVDPSNEPVSEAHLVCAAAELPLRRDRDSGYLEPHAALVGDLLRRRSLIESAETGEIGTRRKRPQREVGLRGAGEITTILEVGSGSLIGTVDGVRVLHECHPGAIYLHWGRQFLVRELDLQGRKAHGEPVSVDYYTSPLTRKETEILEVLDERRSHRLEAFLGRLRVTETIQHELDLPPVRFETVGLWWAAPRSIEEALRTAGVHFMGALHAAEHAMISLMPLHTLCDRGDVGGISIPLHPQLQTGAVFVYDGHPGGVGIAARAFEDLPILLDRVSELLTRSACEEGCPSCVQSPKCGNGNRPLDKQGARQFLEILAGREVIAGNASPATVVEIRRDGEQAEVRRPAPESFATPAAAAAVAPFGGDHQPPLPPPPKPVAAFPQRAMLFDLETQRSAEEVGGWLNAHRMLVALGVVCHLQTGEVRVYREAEVAALVSWLDSADAVIGFNSRRFDYKVLEGYTGIDYDHRWPTLDLLDEIHRRVGFRLSLAHLSAATLEVEKTADGLQSLEWVRGGRLDLVEEYCRRDVEILRDLYLFGRRMGFVVYRDKDEKRVKLPVEW